MRITRPTCRRARSRRSAVCALVLIVMSGSAVAELPFRVAGITFSEAGPRWAVLELATGKQHLVEEGGTVDGVTVVEVTGNSVSIDYGGERHLLRLANGDAAAPPADPNAPDVITLRLDMAEVRSAVAAITRRGRVNAAELNAVFGLPPTARIVGVDHTDVKGAEPALAAIIESFERGEPYKIVLAPAGGGVPREVYFQRKE